MNKNCSEKFEKMSVAGKLAAQTLDMITEYIKRLIFDIEEISVILNFSFTKLITSR